MDIQPIAVQIAKLRCFISLVIDQKEDPQKPNRGILPLPNLETKFVAANSLMPLGDQMPLVPPEVTELENELESIRHEHFRAKNFNQKKALRLKDATTRRQIAKLLEQSGYAKESARRMAAFDPYNQNTFAPFFDPHWMFGHTGFDVVIGNPPYVRHEKIKDQKPELLKAYGKNFFSGTADIYVYFFKRGLDVLNKNGILSYICSNKYFRSGYGLNLRQHLLEKTRVRQIIDFGDAPVFTAIAYPSILVVQNQKPVKSDTMRVLSWNQTDDINNFREIVETQSFIMPQNSLKLDSWRIEKDDVLQLLEKIKAAGTPLGEYVGGRLYRGIVTGLNEAFVIDAETKRILEKKDKKSAELIKPFLRGRDVKRWKINSPNLFLIFTRQGTNIEQYPAIKAYLEQFKPQLEARLNVVRDNDEWFQIPYAISYWNDFEKPKIVYPNITERNTFAWDEENYYLNQKAFILPEASKYLLGILNSRVGYYIFEHMMSKLQNGFFEPSAIFMKHFPIPTPSSTVSSLITNLVNGILLATSQSTPQALLVAYFEQIINALVYELYLGTVQE